MEEARLEGELPARLAGLEIMEAREACVAEGAGARVLRTRKPPPPSARNRRAQSTPRKRPAEDEDVEQVYLNKKMKLNPRALETISEEGAGGAGRKLRRHITFHAGSRLSKDKVRKRRLKIKKLLNNGFLSRNKIPMHVFMQTMRCLDLDAPPLPPPAHTHAQPPSPSNRIVDRQST